MKYISGAFALNLPCSLDTCGDWHASALDWSKLELRESDNSIFGEYGIERCNCVPEHTGEFNVANTLRALLDLLADGNFAVAQGARDDFICNDKYTDEFFNKTLELRGLGNWNEIDRFMEKEYMMEWLRFKGGKHV